VVITRRRVGALDSGSSETGSCGALTALTPTLVPEDGVIRAVWQLVTVVA